MTTPFARHAPRRGVLALVLAVLLSVGQAAADLDATESSVDIADIKIEPGEFTREDIMNPDSEFYVSPAPSPPSACAAG